jgi:ribosome-interacting GTPase 1
MSRPPPPNPPPILLLLAGRPQVIAVCKSADLLLMVLDATKPWSHREILTRELEAVRAADRQADRWLVFV